MYGARLLKDITERPEFYFACKPLTKTTKQIKAFERQLYNLYCTMKHMKETDSWYTNEHQCEATFKCDYIDSCYNGVELTVDNVPSGMKLIFGEDKNVGEVVHLTGLFPDHLQDLVNTGLLRHPDQFGLHQAAGRVLRIG